jgi:CrcB protein
MTRILYVFIGGGAGSIARYLTALAAARLLPTSFPFGTLMVNAVGCFLIGFIHTLAIGGTRISPDARLFLTTGVLGGLTTYSSFNYEGLTLIERGEWAGGALYILLTLLGCAGLGLLGVWGARACLASV